MRSATGRRSWRCRSSPRSRCCSRSGNGRRAGEPPGSEGSGVADTAEPPSPPASTGRRARRWVVPLGAAAALLIAVAVVAVLWIRDEEETDPVPVRRADPVLDLLGWIPA